MPNDHSMPGEIYVHLTANSRSMLYVTRKPDHRDRTKYIRADRLAALEGVAEEMASALDVIVYHSHPNDEIGPDSFRDGKKALTEYRALIKGE